MGLPGADIPGPILHTVGYSSQCHVKRPNSKGEAGAQGPLPA
jgi:hypothetical protein